MEQGGRRGSKEWQQSHQSGLSSGTKVGASAEMDGSTGTDTALNAEKPAVLRRPTQAGNVRRQSNMTSPAMGRFDDAFHGLSLGMHGGEAPRPIIT